MDMFTNPKAIQLLCIQPASHSDDFAWSVRQALASCEGSWLLPPPSLCLRQFLHMLQDQIPVWNLRYHSRFCLSSPLLFWASATPRSKHPKLQATNLARNSASYWKALCASRCGPGSKLFSKACTACTPSADAADRAPRANGIFRAFVLQKLPSIKKHVNRCRLVTIASFSHRSADWWSLRRSACSATGRPSDVALQTRPCDWYSTGKHWGLTPRGMFATMVVLFQC